VPTSPDGRGKDARRAAAIFEARLGTRHPDTQTVRRNLDALLAEMGG